MEFKQLLYFYEVSSKKSFSKAAQSLFLTQQTLSKSVASLEKDLGVQLFVRKSSGIELTSQGNYLRERCEFLLPFLNEIENSIKKIVDTDIHKINFSLIYAGYSIFSIKLINDYNSLQTNHQILLSEKGEQDCKNNVLNGISDAAITTYPNNPNDFIIYPLTKEPMCLIVNEKHPLASKAVIVPADLEGLNLINIKDLPDSYSIFKENLETDYGITVTLEHVVSDVFSAFEVCKNSCGAAIIVEKILSNFTYPYTKAIPLKDNFATWDLYLIFKKNNKYKKEILKFFDYLKLNMSLR